MSATTLKLIAITTMLIDHIGAIFFPGVEWLRMIGRLAFPIFAYFISEGYIKTSNIKKYMLRLLIFAFISQIPFYLVFKNKFYLNIFFTLLMGLCSLYLYDQTNNSGLVWVIGFLTEALGTDYGIYGVLMIYIFYKYHDNFKGMAKYQIILTSVYSVIIPLSYYLFRALYYKDKYILKTITPANFIQVLCLFSLLLIKYYNGEKGRNLKYLFYVFYPAHLTALYLINLNIR